MTKILALTGDGSLMREVKKIADMNLIATINLPSYLVFTLVLYLKGIVGEKFALSSDFWIVIKTVEFFSLAIQKITLFNSLSSVD